MGIRGRREEQGTGQTKVERVDRPRSPKGIGPEKTRAVSTRYCPWGDEATAQNTGTQVSTPEPRKFPPGISPMSTAAKTLLFGQQTAPAHHASSSSSRAQELLTPTRDKLESIQASLANLELHAEDRAEQHQKLQELRDAVTELARQIPALAAQTHQQAAQQGAGLHALL